ncbi:hypothetical protein ANN_20378 [Periplaneta americana]|uniref:Uncharacterized protein n=1 Tax=Periplaneta americana TaxID=6978 RepID=A0ABQ8SCF2_PERAM|nr:hypothetical protein ANN_20378 [Periplaneta americana]
MMNNKMFYEENKLLDEGFDATDMSDLGLKDYIKVNDIRASKKINTFASAHISQFRAETLQILTNATDAAERATATKWTWGDMWRDYIRQDGPMQSRCGTPTSEREDREDHGSDGLTRLQRGGETMVEDSKEQSFVQSDLYTTDTFLSLIVSKRIVLATTYYT